MSENEDKKKKARVDERELAAALGIRRRFIARWRQTLGVRDDHWTAEGGRVSLTHEGAKEAAKSLGVKPMRYPPLVDEKKTGVSVRVLRTTQNAKLCLCVRLDSNEVRGVQVRDNRPFRTGDEFEATDIGGGQLAYYGTWPEPGW